MGNVLKMAKKQQIETLVQLGWSNRAISRETGIHRDTVSHYRAGIQNRPEVPTGSNRPPPRTHSLQLHPYLEKIRTKFQSGLTAQRIYQDLVEEEAFGGGYDSVKRYVKKLRRKGGAWFSRLDRRPGQEAQVDFGTGPLVLHEGIWKRSHLFVMTLSCSRHSYQEVVLRQDVESFLRCHENAFRAFGGVVECVKLDNLKSGVLRANLYEPELNPQYAAFSRHWGFCPDPCPPFKPRHKGKVERGVGYAKNNALKGRKFGSLEDANVYLRSWNKRWARTRIHGSTKRQVWAMFIELEQNLLKPVPSQGFEFFRIALRKVDPYGHVEVDGRFYSVPHQLVSERLVVHYNSQWVKVYRENELVTRHTTVGSKGRCSTLPGHQPPWTPASREEWERDQCRRARATGPGCERLVWRILCDDHPLAVRRCRGILSLARRYDRHIVERACHEALAAEVHQYGFIKTLCEEPDRMKRREASQLTQRHELIRDLGEYQDLFNERSETTDG